MVEHAIEKGGGARAVARCDALGVPPYSDSETGLYRGFLTPAYVAAQTALAGWMRDAGMTVRIDDAANLIGRYDGTGEGPALLIGSHLDSVRDGGRYDGPLGIMLGIEAVASLHKSGKRMPFPIEVIAFGDEEGSRFPAAMLTSRAVAGTLKPEMVDITDAQGEHLGAALAAYEKHKAVILGTPQPASAGFWNAMRAPGSTLAYLEAHIEQGPVLEAEGLAVGMVSAIAAQRRYSVIVIGKAGHAGTNAMHLRRDALAGAAQMILATEITARARGVVATVGRLEALPGAANVVPGEVRFTLDIRAETDARRDAAADDLLNQFAAIADIRGLGFQSVLLQDLPASPCDPRLMARLEAVLAKQNLPPKSLVSGAGHDAMIMAAHCPTAMLFIRCRDGVSHNPAEHVTAEDAQTAFCVMLDFIEGLGDFA